MKVNFSYSNYNRPNKTSARRDPAFGHHPDFYRIAKTRPICYSEYFRGGIDFLKKVRVFRKVFGNNVKPVKMLIVGIAHSEEPFSYLTTIKQIIGDKPIEEALDLHIIDLQSKPDKNELFKDSYSEYIPGYAKEAFIYSPHPKVPLFNYRVNDELFEFLLKTYNDSSKSKWETRLQEEIINYPDNYFDIISANNVLYYLDNDGDIFSAYNNMCDKVNSGGYIITEYSYDLNYKNSCNFVRSTGGFYQKK